VRHWSAGFVGLPWKERGRSREGVDCYGLVVLAFRETHGVELAGFDEAYASVGEQAEISALIAGNAERWPWQQAPSPRPFDVALFRRGRLQTHVGIVVDANRMLHIDQKCEAVIEAFTSGRWRHRLLGFYRHAALAGG
jgi:probable lipoprotein NlpC